MIEKNRSRFLKPSLKWVPRIWSLLILGLVALMILAPDPYAAEPLQLEDWFLLSLVGIAVLGLFVAWRWPLHGAAITIGMMFIRELAWVVLKGSWFPGFLFVWLLIVAPAVLFVLEWRAQRTAGSP
jgi:hypothetical protein